MNRTKRRVSAYMCAKAQTALSACVKSSALYIDTGYCGFVLNIGLLREGLVLLPICRLS